MFVMSLFVALAPAAPAWGCSCVVPDAEELLASHDFAFVGSIVDKQPVGNGQFGGEALYTFQVSGWAKGNLGELVTVRSADNGAACGYELAPGQEAAIFVGKGDGTLRGGLCSTMDAASLEAVADLAEPIAIDTAPPPSEPPAVDTNLPAPIGTIAVGAGAVAATGVAFLLWRRSKAVGRRR